eukprot:767083-Hanusia_phi.AAC.13
MARDDKERVVEAVVELVELGGLLGKAMGALALEQRRRVSIAVEMVANPSVLFLDEPTSGLDVRAARVVMAVLRRIAMSGRTILLTVHQPSSEVFAMFDRLLLLKKGGWVVYNGDLGPERFSAQHMIDYLQAAGGLSYREGSNPAEWMLEVIGAGLVQGEGTVDFVRKWEGSEEAKRLREAIEGCKEEEAISLTSRFALSFSQQAALSASRWLQCYWRDVGYSLHRLLAVVGIALLFSLNVVSLDMSRVDSQAALQSLNGVVFAGLFFSSAVQTLMGLHVIAKSRLVLNRELSSAMYAPSSFLFGITVAELPYLLLVVAIHMLIFYPIVGLWSSAGDVAVYAVSFFLFATVFCFWGQLLAALLPSAQTASLVAGPTVGIMVLFCGFFMPVSVIPWPWKIFYFAFPARYGLKAAMPPQFYCSSSCVRERQGSAPFSCDDASMSNVSSLAASPWGGWGPGCSLIIDRTRQVRASKGAAWEEANLGGGEEAHRMTVWDYWSITTESSRHDVSLFIGVLAVYVVGFRLLTLLALKYLRYIER